MTRPQSCWQCIGCTIMLCHCSFIYFHFRSTDSDVCSIWRICASIQFKLQFIVPKCVTFVEVIFIPPQFFVFPPILARHFELIFYLFQMIIFWSAILYVKIVSMMLINISRFILFYICWDFFFIKLSSANEILFNLFLFYFLHCVWILQIWN